MRPTNSRILPLTALVGMALLLAAAWLFFVATDRLATINYQRKRLRAVPVKAAPKPGKGADGSDAADRDVPTSAGKSQ